MKSYSDIKKNEVLIHATEWMNFENRDIEIKNKLTVTRGEVGGDNGGGIREKSFQEQL